jgi:hypothetical protein
MAGTLRETYSFCERFDFWAREDSVGGGQHAQTHGYRFGRRLVGLSGAENAPGDFGLQGAGFSHS